MPTATPASTPTRPLLLFAAAVAVTAATFGIARAVAKRAGRSFYVRYTSRTGHTIDTEPTRPSKAALHRFERALINDFLHLS